MTLISSDVDLCLCAKTADAGDAILCIDLIEVIATTKQKGMGSTHQLIFDVCILPRGRQ